MTRKFALVCTNEAHEVTSISFHDTRKEAQHQMRRQFDDELGDDGNEHSCHFGDNNAWLIFVPGEFEYYWSIKEVKV